jgi:hypothetical protein
MRSSWFVAVANPGHLATAYYGHRANQITPDAYLTHAGGNGWRGAPIRWSRVVVAARIGEHESVDRTHAIRVPRQAEYPRLVA